MLKNERKGDKIMNKISIRTICFVGMFTAITAVLSILTIPTPWGVPFTLQTFSMSLAGYVLGKAYGTASSALYVLLGLIGVPVYAGMNAGPGGLFGTTGGYLWGFIIMTFLCGIAVEQKNTKTGNILKVVYSLAGLAVCHILGIIQLKFVSGMSFAQSALVGSLPSLVKDILSMVLAYAIAVAVTKALRSANIMDWQKKAQA